jgi:hypothetical protein
VLIYDPLDIFCFLKQKSPLAVIGSCRFREM